MEQDALNRFSDFNRNPVFKVAKVIAVNQWDNSVDLAFLDGNVVTGIPVLTGFGGSNFGAIGIVAPSVDSGSPANVTYPAPVTENTVVQPTAQGIPEKSSVTSSEQNRDIYAVVSTLDGPRVGTGGYFVIGFIYPQISEMKFPDQNGSNVQKFIDFSLFRHPSDFQISIDQNAVMSMQHPCGARITIGDFYANQGSGNNSYNNGPTSVVSSPDITIPGNPLDLKDQDFNNLYTIRNNTTRKAAIRIEDCFGDNVMLNNGAVTAADGAGDKITIGPNFIIINDYTNKNTITIDQTKGIIIQTDTNTITIPSSKASNQEIQIQGGESVEVGTQTMQFFSNTSFTGQPEMYITPNTININSNDSENTTATNTITIDGGQAITLTTDGVLNLIAGQAINLRSPNISILQGPAGQGSGGGSGQELFASGIIGGNIIQGIGWTLIWDGLTASEVPYFSVIGIALVAIGIFLEFASWLGLFSGGVPRDAKTHGAGYVLIRNTDPILAYLGTQLINGAESGRVISEGTGAQSFESIIAALGSALVELGNYGFNPQPPWKVLSTSSVFTNAEIGPLPPPSGAPYSDNVYLANDFGAPAIQSATAYQNNEGFPPPTRQQLVGFFNSGVRPYWFQVAPGATQSDFAGLRTNAHSIVFNQYSQYYNQFILG